MEQVFALSSLTVMPFWVLMILAPRWAWTKRILGSPLVILPAALLYAIVVLPNALAAFPTLANPRLETITALLGSPAGATVAWVHFLAFDLFVGRWAYLDALERQIHPLIMAPILFLILMFGPFGFVLYLVARALVPSTTRGLAIGRGSASPLR